MDILLSLVSQIAASVHVVYCTQGEESNKYHVCDECIQQSQQLMHLSLEHYRNVYKYSNIMYMEFVYVWEI